MSSLLAENTVDAAALADELAKFRIIDPKRLNGLLSDFSGGGPAALAEYLVRRGALTAFQADRALAGESRAIALGPYRLTGLTQPGVFGTVFIATHRDKPGEFRLRTCPMRSLWKAREAKQIVRALASIKHAATVPLIEVDSANGFHYLAWPQVEGELLADRMAQSGPIPPGEAIVMLAHLADALHACHTRQIVHAALTPRSIMLDRNGLPRLLELGAGAILSANLLEEESFLDTLSTAIAATEILKFAAPEYVNHPVGTPAGDQYALGAIGYFMLTGEPPFASSSLENSLSSKLETLPRPLDDRSIPTELVDMIFRMLRVNPEDRFLGLDEVQDRLAGLGGTSHLVAQSLPTNNPTLAEDLQQFTHRDSTGSGSNAGWSGPSSLITDFPTRDDSDASITFELPLPVAEDDPEPVPPIISPARRPPARLEDSLVAKPLNSEPPGGSKSQVPDSKPAPPPDPRKGISTPVHYHTETAEPALAPTRPGATIAQPAGEVREASDSALWNKVKRSLLFWQTPRDRIQVSIFGPASFVPGQPAKLSVCLHTAEAAESVRTLSRAFHHDSELIGTGLLAQDVARDTELGVHLSVANAGISKTLLTCFWRGQPHRFVFDLHVPWESPSGPAPGLVSIGRDNVRIGKIEFKLMLLPRKS